MTDKTPVVFERNRIVVEENQTPVLYDNANWLSSLWSRESRFEFVIAGHNKMWQHWSIGPRRMAQHFIMYLERGEAIGSFDGKEEHLKAGSILWANHGTEHDFRRAPGKKPPTIYHIRFRLYDGDNLAAMEGPGFLVHDGARLQPCVEQLFRAMRLPHPMKELRMKSAAFMLYSELSEEKKTGAGLSRAACFRIGRYVEKNIDRHITPSDLAEVAGLTPDYFSRRFKKTYGRPPRRWLMEERARLAATELRAYPEMRITEIADLFGFSDIYHFSKQFREVFGISPTEYRNRQA